MYVLNQKINTLEEKVSVVDNFSQSIFNFVTSKADNKEEVKEEVKEVTYSNNTGSSQNNKLSSIVENNTNDDDTESESEPNVYNINNVAKDDTKSETVESKELLSEMVSELKESLIKTNTENLNNDLNQIQELKQELKQESSSNELFTLLNNVSTENIVSMDTSVENVQTDKSSKKKEEDLNKMNLTDLKSLAKKKNIQILINNKPKKKETLIQDLLAVM
jgi:hypothetical protein